MRKYGKRVYDGSNDIKTEDIGPYICPTCGKESRLFKRRGYGFQNILSICPMKHTCTIAKELYKKYEIGDRIRYYESTFGKDSVIRLDSYTEGVITNIYPNIIDYQFDFIVDKCVMNGEEIKAPAWIIGHHCRGVDHHNTCIKLLERAPKETQEQMSLIF